MPPDGFSSYCLGLVRGADRDLYYACLLLPGDIRPAAVALTALHIELDAIAKRPGDPMAGMVRLRWWQGGLAAVFGASSLEEEPSFAVHIGDSPILEALASCLPENRSIAQRLIKLPEGYFPVEDTHNSVGYEAIKARSAATTGVLLAIYQDLLAGEPCSDSAVAAGTHISVAWGLANACRVICHGPGAVRDLLGDGKDRPEIALATMCGQARNALVQARDLHSDLDRRARRGLVLAKLVESNIQQIERVKFQCDRLGPPPPLRLLGAIMAAKTGRY